MVFGISKSLHLMCQTHLLLLVQLSQGSGGGATRDTKVFRVKEQRMAVPRKFFKMHNMVTITAYVMFINGILFLVTF